jgi:prevent-host-death family protein
MKTTSVEELGAMFGACLKAAKKGPIVVTRNAKPVGVLLSVNDPEEIERINMSQSKKLRRILRSSERQIAKGKGIPHDEFWRQVKQMRKRQGVAR